MKIRLTFLDVLKIMYLVLLRFTQRPIITRTGKGILLAAFIISWGRRLKGLHHLHKREEQLGLHGEHTHPLYAHVS